MGKRALWAAGWSWNQLNDSHAGTLSATDPTGGPKFLGLVFNPESCIHFFLILLCLSFVCVDQVVCGQNCSFLLQSNGTVLAVGEGQYGRLGQGNSDDLYIPTIISAFQGSVLDCQALQLRVALFWVSMIFKITLD